MPDTNDITLEPKAEFRQLADFGFSVIPVFRGEKCPSDGWKKYQTEKASDETIKAWGSADLNVGVVTGKISDLMVIDVDSPEAQKVVDSWNLPNTPIVKTKKGRHYYFRFPAVELRSRTRIDGAKLDAKGEGGQVIGPGSRHPSGVYYEWLVSPHEVEFAQLPENFIEILKPKQFKGSTQIVRAKNGKFLEAGKLSAFLNKEMQEALGELRSKLEGGRNDTLFKQSARVANHAAALGLDWDVVSSEFYSVALAIGLEAHETEATLESAWKAGQATPTKWIKIAKEWLYVASRDQFWSPSQNIFLKPTAFSKAFAEYIPYEKSTMATFLTRGGLIETVMDFEFNPSEENRIFESKGGKYYNKYCAPVFDNCDGDSQPFEEFLAYLVPENIARDHLQKMIAYTIRNPGKKLDHALLIQSKQGLGKTTLTDIWRRLLGIENTRQTNSEEMASDFQSYLEDTILIVLEEMNLGGGMHFYNKLKPLITSSRAAVNIKHVQAREVDNHANFVFSTNLDVPLFIDPDDRRIFMVNCPAEKRGAEYWQPFHDWLENNLGAIKGYFDRVDLSDFRPHAPPPETLAKLQLKKQSQTPLVQELSLSLEEERAPFNGDIFTIRQVQDLLRLQGMKPEAPQKLAIALRKVGCEPLSQQRLGAGKVSLWTARNTGEWLVASTTEIMEAYLARAKKSSDNDNENSLVEEAS